MSDFLISGFSDEIDENIKIQFETINRLGIHYFEARGVNGRNIANLTEEELEQLQAEMENYKLRVSSIGSPIGKIYITEEFEPHFQKFKRVVEIAKKLGTKYIRIFSFYIPEQEEYEKYYDEVIARLTKMSSYAKEQDVVLLHENEKGIYGDTAKHCAELFEKLYSENFKAVFDPANFVQCGENAKAAFRMLEPYIEYMHIKDAEADGTVVPAGKGMGQLAYILSALKQKDYHGFLSLEPHLGSFAGLEKLEIDDAMTKLEKSSGKTYALAYNALKNILERIEKNGKS